MCNRGIKDTGIKQERLFFNTTLLLLLVEKPKWLRVLSNITPEKI